ncbi:guanylate kinase [Candidatus Saccharibacteria bacterium TM7i]|nr:guanylate kinase [Candidatus Saccharibacteria bacterium TM7i]
MSIESLVENYRTPKEAVQVVKKTKIALLVGISGAGKDTVKKGLLARPGFGEIISHTTRAPRENNGILEKDGVDYHFITTHTAYDMLERGDFIEAKMVHGTVYGTSTEDVLRASTHGVAITDLDVQGVAEYKDVSEDVVAIFIIPPSYEEWIRRLRRRYTTEEEFMHEWPKRRDSAIAELRRALEVPYYHCVINDEIDRAVEVAAEIAQREDVFTRKDDEARIVARDLLQQISM